MRSGLVVVKSTSLIRPRLSLTQRSSSCSLRAKCDEPPPWPRITQAPEGRKAWHPMLPRIDHWCVWGSWNRGAEARPEPPGVLCRVTGLGGAVFFFRAFPLSTAPISISTECCILDGVGVKEENWHLLILRQDGNFCLFRHQMRPAEEEKGPEMRAWCCVLHYVHAPTQRGRRPVLAKRII